MNHADFEIIAVEDDRVFIADKNLGGKSVTNDAEYVLEEVHRQYPGRRLIYRDSEGQWDEIVGPIIHFKFYNERLPNQQVQNELDKLVEELQIHQKNHENKPCELWVRVGEETYRLTGGVSTFGSNVVFFATTTGENHF